MPKERHILRKDWPSLRAEIESLLKENQFSKEEFSPLGIHEDWQNLENRIYQKFCGLDPSSAKPLWIWENLKLEKYSIKSEPPHMILKQLINENESVWFFVNDDKDKFWFYQGKIKPILAIINNSVYIDELYLGSKTLDWLICVNHHDILIATGKHMPNILKSITSP